MLHCVERWPMRAVGSWTVNLCDSCGNCAVLHRVTRDSMIDGKHHKMREIGLFHTTPQHQTFIG